MSMASSDRGRARGVRSGIVIAAIVACTAVTQSVGLVSAGASPSMQSTGSSFASVAIQQWVGQSSTLFGLNINWQVSSSVVGLNNFAQNQLDFAASDIPYSAQQSTYYPSQPYQYLPDVAGGRVDIICDAYISSAGYLKSNKLKVLAVSGEHRSAALPDVPTYKEAGIDASYPLWLGLVAPAKTPKDVIKRLSDALHYATTSKEVGDKLKEQGSDPGVESPEEFNKFLEQDRISGPALVAALKLPKD